MNTACMNYARHSANPTRALQHSIKIAEVVAGWFEVAGRKSPPHTATGLLDTPLQPSVRSDGRKVRSTTSMTRGRTFTGTQQITDRQQMSFQRAGMLTGTAPV